MPFKTISRAAEILQPGEEVVVHSGVYREWVKPARGGTADAMISYRAAEGENVVLCGSDEWTPIFTHSRYIRAENTVTWEADLDASMFTGANVFCLPIGYMDMQWVYNTGYENKRGMLFLDGVPLRQVGDIERLADVGKTDGFRNDTDTELANYPNSCGCFWVEENGMRIHLRLNGDRDPRGLSFEITTREQVFAPVTRYLNYIRVKGFTIRHCPNAAPIPYPQRGALPAFGGHHWIIEDCDVAYANSIGIDLGGGWWYYGTGEEQGHHIVRRCHVHHVVICGIAGWHNMTNQSMLVEDNLLEDCCTWQIPGHCESAAIKIHRTFDSLIRRNVIRRTYYGNSIWLDGEIYDTRITQNVCIDNRDCTWGQIFLEINEGPNMVDNNVMYNTHRYCYGSGWDGSHGFHTHDAEKVILAENLIYRGEDNSIDIASGNTARTNRPFENDFRVYGNIIGQYGVSVRLPNETSKADFNLYTDYRASGAYSFLHHDEAVSYEKWRALGNDGQSAVIPMLIEIDEDALTIGVTAEKGAVMPEFAPPEELLPGLAGGGECFTYDLHGSDRRGVFLPGPIASLPLDGTPVSIDPRKK